MDDNQLTKILGLVIAVVVLIEALLLGIYFWPDSRVEPQSVDNKISQPADLTTAENDLQSADDQISESSQLTETEETILVKLDYKAGELACVMYNLALAETGRDGYNLALYQDSYDKINDEFEDLTKQYNQLTGQNYQRPTLPRQSPQYCNQLGYSSPRQSLSTSESREKELITKTFNDWRQAYLAGNEREAKNHLTRNSNRIFNIGEYTSISLGAIAKDDYNYLPVWDNYYVVDYLVVYKDSGRTEKLSVVALWVDGQWLLGLAEAMDRQQAIVERYQEINRQAGNPKINLAISSAIIYPKNDDKKSTSYRELLVNVQNDSDKYIAGQLVVEAYVRDGENYKLFDTRYISLIEPYGSVGVVFPLTRKASRQLVQPGTVYLKIVVDSGNDYTETNEDDNIYEFNYKIAE